MPLNDRSEIDLIFLKIMERDEFAPRNVYYWVVRTVGWVFFHGYTRHKRRYKGRRVAL